MARKDEKTISASSIAQVVRRHMRVAENSRFLSRMPQFALPQDIPQHFGDLLARIDRAQRSSD